MLSSKRKRTRATGVLGPIARILVVAFTVSAAGCSAEVTRFDFGSKNTTSSIPVPPEPVRNSYGPGAIAARPGTDRSAAAALRAAATTTALRAASTTIRPPQRLSPSAGLRRSRPATIVLWAASTRSAFCTAALRAIRRSSATDPRPSFHQPPPRREWRRHRGPAGRNALQHQPAHRRSRCGDQGRQRIVERRGAARPAPGHARGCCRTADPSPGQRPRPIAADRRPIAAAASEASAAHLLPAGESPPGWEGRYTMRNGDSLHGIALRHRVTVEELKRANGITDPTKVWAGAVSECAASA